MEVIITYTYLATQNPNDRNNIQVGAINLLLELEIREGYGVLDISTATIKNIIIEKPDDTVMVKTGNFLTDGKDGVLYYRTSGSDLDLEGVYNAQAYISMPDFTGYSTPISFTVYPNLPLDNN